MSAARLPAPLAHQEHSYFYPARFKIYQCGRRRGKDVELADSSIAGHGPGSPERPMFPGILSGGDVAWLAPDFPQVDGFWRRFIRRRFEGREGFKLNNTLHQLTGPSGGVLACFTAENPDAIRGLGENIVGVVFNEGSRYDLEYAWESVASPVLVDRKGWAIFASTTNSGDDGNSSGLMPSYFNRLCSAWASGSLGKDWQLFRGTAWDNSFLDKAEVERWANDTYGDRSSVRYREEVLAELVPAAAGLAFPSWNKEVHFCPWRPPSPSKRLVLGMDWGIRSLAWIGAGEVDSRAHLTLRREWTWTDKDARAAGYEFAAAYLLSELPWPDLFMCDSAMNERTGVGGTTILSEFQSGIDAALTEVGDAPALPVIPAPKGPGSRAIAFNQITKLLGWGPALKDGTVPASKMPQFQIMLDRQGVPTCPVLAKDLATAPLDPKHHNDVDKAKIGFHAGDGLGYLLSGVLPLPDMPDRYISPGRHPGFRLDGVRRSRYRTPEVEREEALIDLVQQGAYTPSRYGSRLDG